MLALDRQRRTRTDYWAPSFTEPLSASEPQLAERVRAALDRAVRGGSPQMAGPAY